MSSGSIIPAPPSFRISGIHEEDGVVWFDEVSVSRVGQCPACGHPSTRTAGWVTRKPWTTPWRQLPTRQRIRLRRFCCDNSACPQQTFVERLPDVPPRQRRTTAVTHWLLHLAWTLSAEQAAAVARAAGYCIRPDTLLRLLRRVPLPELETPRVIGVDDWALRKGHRYGAVVVDLEPPRILDVLPDRRAETLAAWLAAHPGIPVASRDRSGTYAHGIATGVPNAQQVTDRWHLLQNLGTAVDAWLAGWRPPAPEPAPPAGFPGSRSTIYAWLQRFHPSAHRSAVRRPAPAATAPPWLRQACCQPWGRLPRTWDRLLSAWLAADATFRRGWTLVRQFVTLVRHRFGRALAAWVRAVETSGIPALAQFARGLRQDWAAVQAAVTAPWSQGPVEAAVTGIKRLRRLMQGRGNWDLLRRRICHGLRCEAAVPRP